MHENLLIKGDAAESYGNVLPDDTLFDLVYLDPPFGTGQVMKTRDGREAYDDRIDPVVLGETIFRTVGRIRTWMTDRALLFVHLDWRFVHEAKATIDRVFGRDNFRGEIVWRRSMPKGLATSKIPNNHDTILIHAKSSKSVWDQSAIVVGYDENDLDEKTLKQYRFVDDAGRRYRLSPLNNPNQDRSNLKYEFLGVTRVWRWTKERMQAAYERGEVVQTSPGAVPCLKRYLDKQPGRSPGSIWTDIYPMHPRSDEFVGYPTQKPEKLLERIIRGGSKEGDVVADLMCGSGTTLAVAHKLGRRFVGMDRGDIAIDTARSRLNALGASYKFVI